MAEISNDHDYYKKMLDLQDKLRKSEEERIRLEERFKILVQESRNRHDACINRLRLRYIEFLEEQRARDERNHKLLGTLDRVDSSLALMTAKTDRLNILRKHYEASLLRAYANRNLPGSTTGDSGIASQNDDRWSRRNISTGQVHWISPEVKSISSSMIRMDHPTEQFASSIKLNPNTDRPLLDSAPLITQSDTILQSSPQRNGVPYTTAINRKTQKYSFSQDPSFNVSRSVYKSPVRIRADENQYGPNGAAASIVEATPLSHQSVPRNVSQSVQMESVQASPRLLLPGSLNANVSQYKLHDVSPSVSPGFTSSVAQSLQFPSNRIITSHSRLTPGNTELSNDFRITSKIPLNGSSTTYQEDPRDIRRSFRELGVHSLTTAEIDEIMRRDEPRNRIVTRNLQNFTPLVKKSISAGNGDGATTNLENQLDRYIHKIRMTQREHDIRSLEEPDHEQNTSGDLLNVSLSDDDLDLPGEAKSKEKLPEEVERVLALADDLASRSLLEDEEIKYPEENRNEKSIRDRNVGSLARQGQTGSPNLAKDAISNDTVLHVPELDSQGNIEQPAKQGLVDLDSAKSASEQGDDSASSEVQKERERSKKDDESISPKIIEEEIKIDRDIHAGEESELKLQWTQELEELAPWDLKCIEKKVEEIDLSDTDKDQSAEKDIVTEDSSAHDSSGEQLGVLDLLDSMPKKLDKDQSEKHEEQDNTEIVNIGKGSEVELKLENDIEEQGVIQSEIKSNEPMDTEHIVDSKSTIQMNDDSEVNQVKVENVEQQENVNQNEDQYVEVPNESQEYQQDYDYGNAGYETNVDQTYQEYGNQQYVEGVNDQFDQQYAQYEQDPNAQYDQDPNAQYQDYNYDEQYDPNQTYEDQNQAYEYSGDIPYDGTAENAGAEEGDVQNQEDSKTLAEFVEGDEKNNEETVQEVQEGNPDNEQSQIQEQTQETSAPKKKRDVIKSLLDSDTESTIERNVSITESDIDFN